MRLIRNEIRLANLSLGAHCTTIVHVTEGWGQSESSEPLQHVWSSLRSGGYIAPDDWQVDN